MSPPRNSPTSMKSRTSIEIASLPPSAADSGAAAWEAKLAPNGRDAELEGAASTGTTSRESTPPYSLEQDDGHKTPSPNTTLSREEQIRQVDDLAMNVTSVGDRRYGIPRDWWNAWREQKHPDLPKVPYPVIGASEFDAVWLSWPQLSLLTSWFGEESDEIQGSAEKRTREGRVVHVGPPPQRAVEVELGPTFTSGNVFVHGSAPGSLVSTDPNVAAKGSDSVPLLPVSSYSTAGVSLGDTVSDVLQRCLASVESLKGVDEEDARLWIRLPHTGNSSETKHVWRLVDDDLEKDGTGLRDDDLPEQEEELSPTSATMSAQEGPAAVPTLRNVLGPNPVAWVGSKVLDLLVETRQPDGRWPRSVVSVQQQGAPESTLAHTMLDWNPAAPKVGQLVDAQRVKDNRWLEAVVTKVESPTSVVVHYKSFPISANEKFATDSPRLKAAHTKVPDWRAQLKTGEELDVHRTALATKRFGRVRIESLLSTSGAASTDNNINNAPRGKSAWLRGTVRKLDYTAGARRVLVRVQYGTWNQKREIWIPLESEKIAPHFTHTQKPRSYTSTSSIGADAEKGTPPGPGLVGFRNLGNTCYMNSTLQCIVRDANIRDYFLSGAFENDLNRKNPLGKGGQVAEAFAELVSTMWSNEYTVISPSDIKRLMSSKFEAYRHHDSEELLTMLLDDLHEDLNRVQIKPITVAVESKGKTDAQLAEESLATIAKRDNSKIRDLMYFLMRQHTTCPTCKKDSTTFQQQCVVPVALPSFATVFQPFILVHGTGGERKAIRCNASLPRRGGTGSTGKDLALWINATFPDLCPDPRDVVVTTCWYATINSILYSESTPPNLVKNRSVRELAYDTVVAFVVDSCEAVAERRIPPRTPLDAEGQALVWSELAQMTTKSTPKEVARRWFRALEPTTAHQNQLAALIHDKLSEEGPAAAPKTDLLAIAFETQRILSKSAPVEMALVKLAEQYEELSKSGSASGKSKARRSANKSGVTGNSPVARISALLKRVGGALSNGAAAPSATESSDEDASQPSKSVTPSAIRSSTSTTELTQESMESRLVFEIRHKREGVVSGKAPRMFDLGVISREASWDDLRAYLQHQVGESIASLPPRSQDSVTPTAAEAAIQLEAPQVEFAQAVESEDPSTWFHIKYCPDNVSTSLVDLPDGPGRCELAESCYVAIVWTEAGMARWAPGMSSDDLGADDEFKYKDPELALGPVARHSSVADAKSFSETGRGSEKAPIALEDCLKLFTVREMLEEDNMYYCDACKTHVQAYRKLDLWSAPEMLILQLKRFVHETSKYGERIVTEKILEHVSFPVEGLDITPFVIGPEGKRERLLYDLVAVSNHMGQLQGGHYTAYVKAEDGSWWLMDDSRVTRVDDPKEVVSRAGYVLFYQRRR